MPRFVVPIFFPARHSHGVESGRAPLKVAHGRWPGHRLQVGGPATLPALCEGSTKASVPS